MRLLIRSRSLDPLFNLSLEQWLLHDFPSLAPTLDDLLLLYRNTPCLVIGRNQNAWLECNVDAAATLSVPILRRWSGGGAVYHDLGNANYSLHRPRALFSRNYAAELLVRALKRPHLSVSPRHDIFMTPSHSSSAKDVQNEPVLAKVSGSAFKIARDRAYAHGTMLLSSNLARLTNLLSSPLEEASCLSASAAEKRSFGVSSVRSPVSNVSDLGYEDFCHQLEREFSPEKSMTVDEDDLCMLGSGEPMLKIREYMATLSSWEWCFGKSPPAWIRRSGQSFGVFVEDGVVTQTSHPKDSSLLTTRFTPEILS